MICHLCGKDHDYNEHYTKTSSSEFYKEVIFGDPKQPMKFLRANEIEWINGVKLDVPNKTLTICLEKLQGYKVVIE